MATLTAILLTGADPRPVQITLAGTTAGQAYEIRGTTADGSSWPISGGVGVSAGTQVVLADTRAALNSVVTYQAVVAGVTIAAAPVTIESDDYAVIQTIDGQTVVGVEIIGWMEPRSYDIRSKLFEVAGRGDPAARLDVPGSPTYTWELETHGPDSVTMQAILESGSPIVRRTVTGLRDLKPVVLGIVTGLSDELSTEGVNSWRTWKLTVREIPDPQPSTALAAFTWDDFDAAMSDRVWSWHSLLASAAGWSAVAAALSVQQGGYSAASFLRATASSASQVDVFESVFTTAAATLGGAVAAGNVITVTFRVKGTPGRSVSAAIKWSGGAVATGAPVTLTGGWQMVSVTATAPAGSNGCAPGVRMASAGVAAGTQLDVSAPTISRGAMVPQGTFDELFADWDAFDRADWSLL